MTKLIELLLACLALAAAANLPHKTPMRWFLPVFFFAALFAVSVVRSVLQSCGTNSFTSPMLFCLQ
jgi:hypothetical protein